MSDFEWYARILFEDKEEESLSASSTSISASNLATQQAMKQYAEMFADRMQEGNLDEIDKDHISGMIYAILMKDELDQEIIERHLDARPDKEQLFTNEEFEI
jgi:hypothetical protein